MPNTSAADQQGTTESLTVKEVLKALNCHENTVWNLLKRGVFPHAWKLGSDWRIPKSDLENYIASRRRFPQEKKSNG